MIVHVPEVAATRDVGGAPVPDSQVIAHAESAGRDRPLRLRSNEVHRNKAAAEGDHVGPGYGRLQPSPVMKGSIPVIDRRVIAPEGKFRHIVPVIANDGALQIDVVDAWSGGQAHFGEVTDLWRKCGSKVQDELSELEAAIDAGVIVG